MKDIFDTRKYLDINYVKTWNQKDLHELKVNIIGKEAGLKQRLKIVFLSLNAFFMNLLP